MAKKKESSGQGVVITLVFFVILSLIMGTLAYFGFSDQEKLQADAKEAKNKMDNAFIEADQQEARKLALRVAVGVEDAGDRAKLETYSASRKKDIADEVNLIKGKFGNNFKWDNIAGGDVPAPAPAQSILQISDTLSKDAANARKAEETAKADATAARANAQKAQDQQVAAAQQFDKNIADLTKKFNDLNTKYETKFKEYVSGLDNRGKTFDTIANGLKDANDDLQRNLEETTKKKEKQEELNRKLLAEKSFDGPDLIKNDFKKGNIVRKDGEFVTLSIGSLQQLRPNTTFAILPPGVTWRDAKEKEKLIKGKVEVIEVLGPYSSRAKIIDQAEPIRNPIATKDELYNPAWSANERIHVAFAGAIDLHGTGYDANEEFIRKLESIGVVIDSYLDLKTRQIKGPGINLNTKFLILGPDAKQLEGSEAIAAKGSQAEIILEVSAKMGAMKKNAKELGVQIVEARKFLNYMGVRIPERQQPLDYGYLDKFTPLPGSEEPKADAPKADAPKEPK